MAKKEAVSLKVTEVRKESGQKEFSAAPKSTKLRRSSQSVLQADLTTPDWTSRAQRQRRTCQGHGTTCRVCPSCPPLTTKAFGLQPRMSSLTQNQDTPRALLLSAIICLLIFNPPL